MQLDENCFENFFGKYIYTQEESNQDFLNPDINNTDFNLSEPTPIEKDEQQPKYYQEQLEDNSQSLLRKELNSCNFQNDFKQKQDNLKDISEYLDNLQNSPPQNENEDYSIPLYLMIPEEYTGQIHHHYKKCPEFQHEESNYKQANITRNYINAILKYIRKNELVILEWLKKNNLKLPDSKKFFKNQLSKRINKLYSIKHLKRLLSLKTCQGKIFRVFGYKFIREESFQIFFSKSFKDQIKQLRHRHVIEEAFKNPVNFSQLNK